MPDVVCLTETWLSVEDVNCFACNSEYNVFRADRPEGTYSTGGGVAILCRKELKAFCSVPFAVSEACQGVWVDIINNRGVKLCRVGCFYRRSV